MDYLSIFLIYIIGHLWWCNGYQAWLVNQHEWVRVSLGTPIHSALCYIEANSFVNYYIYLEPLSWCPRRAGDTSFEQRLVGCRITTLCILSAFGDRCRARISLLNGRNLNADVNIVSATGVILVGSTDEGKSVGGYLASQGGTWIHRGVPGFTGGCLQRAGRCALGISSFWSFIGCLYFLLVGPATISHHVSVTGSKADGLLSTEWWFGQREGRKGLYDCANFSDRELVFFFF